jgi:hypothetical protein
MPICDEKKENHYSLLCAQMLRHFIKKRKRTKFCQFPSMIWKIPIVNHLFNFFIDLSCGGVDDILKKRTQHCDTTRRWDLNKRRFTSNFF